MNMAGKRVPANPADGRAASILRALGIALLLATAGCATPERAPGPPPVQVADDTWLQVDGDIVAASQAAREPARNYAHGFMARWRELVHQRTESDFIPWLTGYWTRQWLAIRVAWYKLNDGEGNDPAVRRLAAYLQEQYDGRVLAPVAREIDPAAVRDRTTTLYVRLLGEQLQAIPRRHGVPRDQFDRRLADIPAIAPPSPGAPGASLRELVDADPLARLPAYAALNARIRKAAGEAGTGPSGARISPAAEQASEKMMSRLAVSGGASAAAAAVGGVAGMVISLGAAGFGALAHESERPALEAQLRENLAAALDEQWRTLTEDPASSVMAAVDHIAGQIEGGLARPETLPLELPAAPQESPLPDLPPVPDDETGAAAADVRDAGR